MATTDGKRETAERERAERGEAILPAAVGEDGVIRPPGGDDTGAPREGAGGSDGEEAEREKHDLAHGNDLKTP